MGGGRRRGVSDVGEFDRAISLLPDPVEPWVRAGVDIGEIDIPFYELSIVPMLTALLRYLLVLEQGGGGAPEEVFAKDRVLQLLGLVWIVIYGVAVYAG